MDVIQSGRKLGEGIELLPDVGRGLVKDDVVRWSIDKEELIQTAMEEGAGFFVEEILLAESVPTKAWELDRLSLSFQGYWYSIWKMEDGREILMMRSVKANPDHSYSVMSEYRIMREGKLERLFSSLSKEFFTETHWCSKPLLDSIQSEGYLTTIQRLSSDLCLPIIKNTDSIISLKDEERTYVWKKSDREW